MSFESAATGRPESLIPPGKTVIVASSRGGIYTDGPQKPFDFQETYLKAVFGFLGLTDISFIRAEGVSIYLRCIGEESPCNKRGIAAIRRASLASIPRLRMNIATAVRA
jgi:hypothetical protein